MIASGTGHLGSGLVRTGGWPEHRGQLGDRLFPRSDRLGDRREKQFAQPLPGTVKCDRHHVLAHPVLASQFADRSRVVFTSCQQRIGHPLPASLSKLLSQPADGDIQPLDRPHTIECLIWRLGRVRRQPVLGTGNVERKSPTALGSTREPRFIREEVFKQTAKVRPESHFAWPHSFEELLFENVNEEPLREILGLGNLSVGAPEVDVDRPPVPPHELVQGRVLWVGNGPFDERPRSRGEPLLLRIGGRLGRGHRGCLAEKGRGHCSGRARPLSRVGRILRFSGKMPARTYLIQYSRPKNRLGRPPMRTFSAICLMILAAPDAVSAAEPDLPVSFRNQLVPMFTRLGCNAGGCHGKASGQNGFKLSLLGYDPAADHAAIVKEARGRRVFPAAIEQSLFLTKALGTAPHGGGRRLVQGSDDHQLLLRWLKEGTPFGPADEPTVTKIACTPKDATLTQTGEQKIRVTATYSDGSTRDVTREAQFKSSQENVAVVDLSGLIAARGDIGESAVMARYLGHVDVCSVVVPTVNNPEKGVAWPELPRGNFIDEHVRAKWKRLGLIPSALSDDATFIRRVYLDAIGTLPTTLEVRAFLADKSADKRAKLIDKILERPEYADFWAMKWGELLRNKRRAGQEALRGTVAFHDWIHDQFNRNVPYDQFVRDIVAANGTVDRSPPVIWYREVKGVALTNDTAQLFLGTRLNCAQCHHHPYEKWGQDDYFRFQAFFDRVAFKGSKHQGEQTIYVRKLDKNRQEVPNPKPRGLDGPDVDVPDGDDPRHKLVDWMTAPENPYFARAIANRYWGHFHSRGLVEPVDDMRVTNPPSNPALLDALAKDLVEHKYDLKHLARTIMNSTTYQLASDPRPGNVHDQQNFARAYPRRLIGEVLLDATSRVTGVAEVFDGMPVGMRAIQLPDEAVPSYFLDTFGRPSRESACDCERTRDGNLAQALHLLNSPGLQAKIANPKGTVAKLAADTRSDESVIEELYFAVYARAPRQAEQDTMSRFLSRRKDDRKAALEDMVWALLNSKEFLFNH